MYRGWHLVAFTRELKDEITPTQIGALPMLLLRASDHIQAYDARCPHRGAHLAYGGKLEKEVIVCPFHGFNVALGDDKKSRYRVRGYPTLVLNDAVFVLISARYDFGFSAYCQQLAKTHLLVAGFSFPAKISSEYVTENVFDTDHFTTVHGINHRPNLQVSRGASKELLIEAVFFTNQANPWQSPLKGESYETRFFARVFSPTLVCAELGAAGNANVVITAATPTQDDNCVVRVAVAVPLQQQENGPPTIDVIRYLLRDSKTAFEQDMVIWEHLDRNATPDYSADDEPVIKFREFCKEFLAEDEP